MTQKFEGVKFTAPEGRLVSGHPMIMQDKKNYNTKQVELDKNGQVRRQVMFKVAYPEAIFLSHVWPYLSQAAAQGFGGQAVPQNFKYKFKHCNDLDKNGKRYGAREGHEGCYIVTYSTEGFVPPSFKQPQANTFIEITNPAEIKTGYHVVVDVQAKHNGNYGDTGGLYVNPNQILLTRIDSEIFHTSADPTTAFGGNAAYVLQGAPQGQQPHHMPNHAPQGQPMYGQQPPQGQQPVYNNAPQGQQPVYGQAPSHPSPTGAPMYNNTPMGNAVTGVPHGAPTTMTGGGHVTHATTYPSNVPPAHDLVNNAVNGYAPQGAPQGMYNNAPVNQAPPMTNAPHMPPQGAPSPMPQHGGHPAAPHFPQR